MHRQWASVGASTWEVGTVYKVDIYSEDNFSFEMLFFLFFFSLYCFFSIFTYTCTGQ